MKKGWVNFVAFTLLIVIIVGFYFFARTIDWESGSNRVKEINISLLEKNVLEKTNEERSKLGLKNLTYDSELTFIAEEHSKDMWQRNFFDHINPDGEDPTKRAIRNHISVQNGNWYGIGENLAYTPINVYVKDCGGIYDENQISYCIVKGWMSSTGHRENILNNNYRNIGVGIFCTISECWSTQDFR